MTTCRIRVERDAPDSGRFEWAMLDGNGTALASGVADLDHPPVQGACEVVLACDLVVLEGVAAPAAQQRRLSAALRYLVEDSAIPEPERLHVAATSLSKDRLCLAIVDRQWLEKLLSRLERSGLIPQRVYPECLLPGLLPHAWTVVWNGRDGFARTGDAEGFSLDSTEGGNPPVALRLALENSRKAGAEPWTIIARAAPGAEEPDIQQWSAALGTPVESGPAWHWASGRSQPGLDLLQGEFALRGAGGAALRRLRRPAVLAAALLVLGSFGIALDWGAKAHDRKTLLAEMRAIYRETFGDNAVVVDPPLQMTRALADLRQQAGQIGPADLLALLGTAADQLLDPRRHRIESMVYEKGALSVTLQPYDPQQAGALLDELRAKARLGGLDVAVDAAGSTGRVTLRLRAKTSAGT
jgi:general secretion pathway protein L